MGNLRLNRLADARIPGPVEGPIPNGAGRRAECVAREDTRSGRGKQLLRGLLLLLLAPGTVLAGDSPYTLRWSVDGPLAGAAAVLSGTTLILRSSSVPLTAEEVSQLSASDVNAFDRGATANHSHGAAKASDVLLVTAVAAPVLLLADSKVRADAGTVGAMYLETMALALAVPWVVKELAGRERPYVYNPSAPLEEKTTLDAKRSFFSQHATFAFSAAVFLGTVYDDYNPDSDWSPYIWAGSLGIAGVVAWLRVEAGEHFPTDAITGAAVGAAIGWLVPALHRTADTAWSSAALPQRSGFSFAVRYTF